MKRVLWPLNLLLLLIMTVLPAKSAGLIIIHDPGFWYPHPPYVPPPRPPIRPPRPYVPPQPVWAPLEVHSVQATVRIQEQIAQTTIEEEFYNPNSQQLEGTFLFPVPKGAHLSKFTMEINGKQVEAELLAADKARGIYEDIVRKLKDPALLEYSGRDLFKVRIFPIEPHAKKRITLSYAQVLKADSGLVDFRLPLSTEKYSARPLKNVSLKINLESKRALKAIYSPSHKVEVKRDGDKKATVGFELSEVKPDTDFQLFYSMEEAELGLSFLSYKKEGEDGYFLLLASPGIEAKNTKVIPKDVAFVLDTSGSMAGAKLDQAKKALLFCVENLNDGDRFEIMRFATEVEPLFDKLVDASAANRSRARDFIRELKPIGGTAIDDALRKALALRAQKATRPFVVIFLTDGRPTIGTTDEEAILKNVTRQNEANTRIFNFGIGTDVNTHLLDKIAEETRAFSQYVLPEEDLEVKVSNFFTKIKEPVLANPKLSFPGDVRVTKLYPSPVPDLFKGEQLVLAGRFSGKGDGAIQIEGSVNDERKVFAYDVKFPGETAEHEFIPRLWATRRVGYLLDEIRLRGENQELKDEVTELARKYGIVTPYTAYLIIEDERGRGLARNALSLPTLSESETVRRESRLMYERFRRDRTGDDAVAGARSGLAFKSANVPSDGIAQATEYALRPQATTSPGAAPAPEGTVRLGRDMANGLTVSGSAARIAESAQKAQFVGGRSFYQNGDNWIDSESQKKAESRRVRVQFDSPEYFDLIRKHPEALSWLALGRNVQFVLGEAVYEIYE